MSLVEVQTQRRIETFDIERVKLAEEVAKRSEGRTVAALSHTFIPGVAGYVSVLLVTELLIG